MKQVILLETVIDTTNHAIVNYIKNYNNLNTGGTMINKRQTADINIRRQDGKDGRNHNKLIKNLKTKLNG